MKKIVWIILISLGVITNSFADERTVNLVVGYKSVHFAGKTIKAIAVNDQIPGPILHFKKGDHVTIHVYNRLDRETAIHWHGVLVPWQMDGVLGVTQRGIPPGGVFHYQFTLYQSGTYWYHAHAGLQEQLGLYGAFLIDPPKQPSYAYTKDYVVVLSDWSNTHPDQILANLKKEGDYYSPRFPLQPSLMKFIHDYRKASPEERQNLIADYKMMQQMRMSIYDISDVAYDAFLLNGQPNSNPWTAPVKVGDTVRLRFIGAGASTIFHVKMPGASMQMVQMDGNDVRPYVVDDFKIAPGETYDVLVKIQKNNPYIIYAESIDTVGAAYGALITSPNQFVNDRAVAAFPEPLPATREMMTMSMNEMNHDSSSMNMESGMTMSQHDMSAKPTLLGTKYQNVVAAVKTNDPNKPVYREIRMELFGYMDRFIWFINGVPEYKAHPILLEPGKRYRIIFTNTSMMHHPMHIHGHWFILREGKGAYDPLLHTIDVPPGATMTADVDTDASGQWLFHCHLLYHMMSGMSRVFQYTTLIDITKDEAKPQNEIKQTAYYNRPIVRVDEVRPIDPSIVYHPMAHPMGWFASNYVEIGEDPFHNVQRLTFKGLYGRDYDKLELFANDAEVNKGSVQNADLDIFYWHLINQFWAIKGGANYTYRPANTPYWQPGIGIEGVMPYFIDTDVRGYFKSGSAKLDVELSRDTQITNNFFIRVGARSILASKTESQAAIGSGLNQMRYMLRPYYRLMPGLNVFAEYEHEQDYGAFKKSQSNAGESAVQNTLTLGLALLF
jgi:FtsP/CotA-like multicopper oxidase with cupredoxin domain